jgi:hypothetical protein
VPKDDGTTSVYFEAELPESNVARLREVGA